MASDLNRGKGPMARGCAASSWLSSVLSVAATVALSLILSGCSGTSSDTTGTDAGISSQNESISCSSLLDTILARVRAEDTSDAIDAELDHLGAACPAEYDVFVDYTSISSMSRAVGGGSCAELADPNASAKALELARADGLCDKAPTLASACGTAPPANALQAWEAQANGCTDSQPTTSGIAPGAWTCTWDPTYNNDWHDDVICSNGSEQERPYLRPEDNFVTYDEIMETGRQYEDELNGR